MRKLAYSAALAVSLAAVACAAPGSEPASNGSNGVASLDGATAAQSSALARLELDTARPWKVLLSDVTKAAMHLSAPRTGKGILVRGASDAEVARTTTTFLASYKDLFKMHDPAAELRASRIERDELSMTHARFQQTIGGLRVDGAEVMAHYDAAGRVTSIDSTYLPGVDGLDLSPTVDAGEALRLAKADAKAHKIDGDESRFTVKAPELIVWSRDGKAPRLAYRSEVRAIYGNDPAIWISLIDAKSGEVFHRYNNLQTIDGSGVGVNGTTRKLSISQSGGSYALTDASRGVQIVTYTSGYQEVSADQGATKVTSANPNSWDTAGDGAGAAVDAHYFAGVVYDYYKTVHARSSIDGNGMAMHSTVHFGQQYDNAFWDGTAMNYGDGDGQQFKAFSAALDVIGHEFSHGVTQASSNLDYEGQPGALNESVSDIMGMFIEYSLTKSEQKAFVLGEDLGDPIRSATNPGQYQQPAAMSEFVNTQQDNGGVHTNSGIPNNAMALMTVGGSNPTTGTKVAFGLGWDKSQKIWYRAAFHYLTQTSNFAQAAQATAQAAQDLTLTSNEQNIVDCAWKATGVVQGSCNPIVNPQSTTPAPTPTDPDGTDKGGTVGDSPSETTGDTGDSSATGDPTEGDPSDDEDTTPKKKSHLIQVGSSGCNVGATGGLDLGGLVTMLGAAVALGAARRRRK